MTSPDSTIPQSALYRAVWRWHFYAGLLVAPFAIHDKPVGMLAWRQGHRDLPHSKLVLAHGDCTLLPMSEVPDQEDAQGLGRGKAEGLRFTGFGSFGHICYQGTIVGTVGEIKHPV